MLTVQMARDIEDADVTLSLRSEYVGRNMTGESRVGLVTSDLTHFTRAVVAYGMYLGFKHDNETYYALQDFLKSYNVDSLGHDLIVY
jgi:hypothetical protein